MMSAEKTKEASAVEDLYKAFGVLADAKDKAGEIATSVKPRPKTLIYTKETMQAACRAVLNDKKGLREAAREHGVPSSTLRDRLRGKRCFHEVERTVITAAEEAYLARWIKECAKQGCGRTMKQVQKDVQTILNKRKAVTLFKDNLPGRKWVTLFLKRHADVTFETPKALGSQKSAVSKIKFKEWFKTAQKEITPAGRDVLDHCSRTFNCQLAPRSEAVTLTADETRNDEPEDHSVDLPSPTSIPSALIPPSESASSPSFTVTTTITSPSSSNIIPSVSSQSLVSAMSTAPSSFSNICNVSTKEALDRLLDLAAKSGLDRLVRLRTLHTLGIEPDDHEERLFYLLYSKLISPSQTNNSDRHTFDNLHLPKQQTIQTPKRVSSDPLKQYSTEEEKKEMKEGKDKEKREREEKKKSTEEEKEKKKQEQERKEKRVKLREGRKRKAKCTQTEKKYQKEQRC